MRLAEAGWVPFELWATVSECARAEMLISFWVSLTELLGLAQMSFYRPQLRHPIDVIVLHGQCSCPGRF